MARGREAAAHTIIVGKRGLSQDKRSIIRTRTRKITDARTWGFSSRRALTIKSILRRDANENGGEFT